jgi:hypothetical protein
METYVKLSPALENWHIAIIATSALFWLTCFLVSRAVCAKYSKSYSRLSGGERVEWDSRVVSNIHAVVGMFSGVYCVTLPMWDHAGIIGSTPTSTGLLCISIGYFIYDFTLCVLNESIRSVSTLVHHSLGVVCWGVGVTAGVCHYAIGVFLITETTTPFVNQRFFFDKMGMKTSIWNVVNGLAMWIGFLVVRVVYANFAVWYSLYSHQIEYYSFAPALRWSFSGLMGVITVLNTYWFYRISLGIVRAYRGRALANQTKPSKAA